MATTPFSPPLARATGTFSVNVVAVTANSITVNQGVPTFTNGTITLAGTEGLAQAGYITLNEPATINSVMAGTIGMTKAGASTLTLAGANSPIPVQTTINEGTLQVGGGGTRDLLIPPAPLSTTAPWPFNRSDTLTQGTDFGTIGGTGQVTKIGANTLVLNSANTYSGGTVLANGYHQRRPQRRAGFERGILAMGTNVMLLLNGNTISVGDLTVNSGPIHRWRHIAGER
jgi:autotransporter-associated beta strand protein